MIAGQHPVVQALLGTLLTWGLTALGAALVFVFTTGKRKVLDASLGFAAGVMLAASYWSLLSPAIEMAEQSQTYGIHGEFAFIPVSIGFALGAVFVYMSDVFLPYLGVSSPNVALALSSEDKFHAEEGDFTTVTAEPAQDSSFSIGPMHRRKASGSHKVALSTGEEEETSSLNDEKKARQASMKGLAVGVGFAAVGKTHAASFEKARNLAWGIGIQNFPEGLAVSLPLRGSGMSVWKSFWYGQLSGMVEPLAGVFGAVAMVIAEPLLPYALAFAAGAMVYVVVDDIVPEANTSGNAKLASWGCIVGFIIMMSLDVGFSSRSKVNKDQQSPGSTFQRAAGTPGGIDRLFSRSPTISSDVCLSCMTCGQANLPLRRICSLVWGRDVLSGPRFGNVALFFTDVTAVVVALDGFPSERTQKYCQLEPDMCVKLGRRGQGSRPVFRSRSLVDPDGTGLECGDYFIGKDSVNYVAHTEGVKRLGSTHPKGTLQGTIIWLSSVEESRLLPGNISIQYREGAVRYHTDDPMAVGGIFRRVGACVVCSGVSRSQEEWKMTEKKITEDEAEIAGSGAPFPNALFTAKVCLVPVLLTFRGASEPQRRRPKEENTFKSTPRTGETDQGTALLSAQTAEIN
ncbi:hypothetical protein Bbelb_430990 [Branchiostoma belcheri]|nr:hypothetical protein Bbelb_430990 [Branchiostoma belcheri]